MPHADKSRVGNRRSTGSAITRSAVNGSPVPRRCGRRYGIPCPPQPRRSPSPRRGFRSELATGASTLARSVQPSILRGQLRPPPDRVDRVALAPATRPLRRSQCQATTSGQPAGDTEADDAFVASAICYLDEHAASLPSPLPAIGQRPAPPRPPPRGEYAYRDDVLTGRLAHIPTSTRRGVATVRLR